MKKFLFVLPCFPWPLTTGGDQGVFNSIRAVCSYAEVHIAYYAGQHDSAARYHDEFRRSLGGKVEIHPYMDHPLKWTAGDACRKIGNKIFKRADHLSYMLFTRLHDAAYYDFVNSLITAYGIDLVQVEFAENLDFALTLPAGVKRVFVHHELRFVRNARLLEQYAANTYNRALAEEEKAKEIALLNRFDLVLTVSEADRAKLLEAGVTVPVQASFSICNTGVSDAPASAGGHRISFVGPDAHYQNKLGLGWFLCNVWPLLKERDDAFRLEVFGQWHKSAAAAISRRYKDVSFRGFVDDLPSAIQGSTMAVPVLIGSGIRMKILEAMAAGIPFVSTTVGAEGLPVEDGVQGFLADDPAGFADALIRAEDPAIRKSMAEQGRKLVRERYSPEALARSKREACEKLLGEL